MFTVSNPILGFALIVIFGYLGGLLAKKVHLPSIIGNLGAGLVSGPFCLKVFSYELIESGLSPLNSIAFGFIAFSIALHLKVEEFKKVCILTFSDILLTVFFISFSFFLITGSVLFSLLLGITGATTAPAASLAIVRETRAKGPLVSALLPTIALNNVVCTILFTFILGILCAAGSAYLHVGLIQLLIALFLGVGVGLLFCFSVSFVRRLKVKILWASLFSLMILVGIADQLHISPLFASICMGLIITNTKEVADEVFEAFGKIESFIYLLFFTMAGAHLNPSFIPQKWKLIILFVMSRFTGKLIGGYIGAFFTGLYKKALFGVGLLPQAGLALAFLLLLEEKGLVPSLMETYSTVVLSAVVLNEFLGSVATKILFRLTKEEGKAYPAIFGFIRAEDIVIGIDAEDKWEAIAKLVHHLCIRKGIPFSQEGQLLEEVIKREMSMTTGIGRSLAIPHGIVQDQRDIMGIFAISYKGIDFGAMDGKPVHFIILSLIPEDKLDKHLKYLTQLSKIFSKPFVSSALMEARTEEEVLRILWEAQQ